MNNSGLLGMTRRQALHLLATAGAVAGGLGARPSGSDATHTCEHTAAAVNEWSCLTRPDPPDPIVPPGGPGRYRVIVDPGTRFDAYNNGNHATWYQLLDGSSNQRAVQISGGEGGCWSGGAVVGTQSLNLDRSYANFGNSKAVQHGVDARSVNFLYEGLRVHNYWDAFSIGDREVRDITYRGCWITWIRDDLIDAPLKNDGVVWDDCLIDGTFVGWSTRASGGNTDRSNHRWTIKNNLFRLAPMPGPPDPPPDPGHGGVFKLDLRSPHFDLFGNIFAWEQEHSVGSQDGSPLFDLEAAQKLGCSAGNTICWLGAGDYPADWWVPPGFQVLTGADAQSTWNNAVAAWKTNHPLVYRVPGVD